MMSDDTVTVGAIVLAAGRSSRMGTPKMVLPWNDSTVIGHIVSVLHHCSVDPIVVVTGGAKEKVEAALSSQEVILAENAEYATTEMMDSLKIGLMKLPPDVDAVLIVLGDQPFIDEGLIGKLIDRFRTQSTLLIIPSYNKRRGHPWLVGRTLWAEMLALDETSTLRDFIQSNTSAIDYLVVDTPSVLLDLDTPDDYARLKPD